MNNLNPLIQLLPVISGSRAVHWSAIIRVEVLDKSNSNAVRYLIQQGHRTVHKRTCILGRGISGQKYYTEELEVNAE